MYSYKIHHETPSPEIDGSRVDPLVYLKYWIPYKLCVPFILREHWGRSNETARVRTFRAFKWTDWWCCTVHRRVVAFRKQVFCHSVKFFKKCYFRFRKTRFHPINADMRITQYSHVRVHLKGPACPPDKLEMHLTRRAIFTRVKGKRVFAISVRCGAVRYARPGPTWINFCALESNKLCRN